MTTRLRSSLVAALAASAITLGCARAPKRHSASELARFAAAIDADTTLRRSTFALDDLSAEGGVFATFRADTALRKAVARLFGETFIATEAYYLSQGRVFLRVRIEIRHDEPLGGGVSSTQTDSLFFDGDQPLRAVSVGTGDSSAIRRTPAASRVVVEAALDSLLRAARPDSVGWSPGGA